LWILFFIILFCLFIVNWQLIRTSVKSTGVFEYFFGRSEKESPIPIPPVGGRIPDTDNLDYLGPVISIPEITDMEPGPESESDFPADDLTVVSEDLAEPALLSPEELSALPQASPPNPVSAAPSTGAAQDRTLYFIHVDPDGAILRTRVTRTLPVTESPLENTLNMLLQGPSAEERRRDLLSLIPPGTKLLSVIVRDATASINFSEEFQFNTYGVEGYVAQLQQIIWTATEFPTVKSVRILIEGRVVDYLGEGIMIGGPLNRNSL
jgi:hypothetical protein